MTLPPIMAPTVQWALEAVCKGQSMEVPYRWVLRPKGLPRSSLLHWIRLVVPNRAEAEVTTPCKESACEKLGWKTKKRWSYDNE